MLTIGAMARRAGVSVDTVRHYEKLGLVLPAARSQAGYRLYNTSQAERLGFIRRAKRCGFNLREIEGLLIYRDAAETDREAIRRAVRRKKEQLDEQVACLRTFSDELGALLEACNEKKEPNELCPILCRLNGR